jgi:prepilin-type N-terminal cleavage/methylation domain-containing protein
MVKTKNADGFTLIEVMIAVILVGLAISALVGANVAFTRANAAGADMSTAEFLIEQIRELTITLAVIDPQTGAATFGAEEGGLADYDDLDDFDNANFSPPIDAAKATLSSFTAFSQQVTVQNVNASDFGVVVADHGSDFVRVTVSVFLNSKQISSASWIRALY